MRVLAVVLARGGSKRIPGKNIRPLAGKPLIVWTLEAARGIGDICDVLVSTDDAGIAQVARNAGALVPWMRPMELATDGSSSVDACLHALGWYEEARVKVDGLLLLQPTSPFRSRQSILRGIDAFRMNIPRPVVGVSPAKTHPSWCFRIEDNGLKPFTDAAGLNARSQDLAPAYAINGAIYLVSPQGLRDRHSFFSDDMVPILMTDPAESIDIDSEWDWKMAEALMSINEHGDKSEPPPLGNYIGK